MGPNPSPEVEAKDIETKEASDAPAKPPKFTREQIGKIRRQFMTVVHGRVAKCGHRFHPTDQPRTNCADCWEAFFRVHTGVVQGIQSILSAFGEEELVKARGTKFVKRYKAFAAMVEAEEAMKPTPEDMQVFEKSVEEAVAQASA